MLALYFKHVLYHLLPALFHVGCVGAAYIDVGSFEFAEPDGEFLGVVFNDVCQTHAGRLKESNQCGHCATVISVAV